MYYIKVIIDFIIVLLLVRLLIRPIEANFNQIYEIIFKITDYILKPAKSFLRSDMKAVLLSVAVLVLLRGLLYMSGGKFPLLTCAGTSFLELVNLLFQFYMAVWFIAILTGYRTQTSVISIIQRAFMPISSLSSRFGISRQYFSLFSFVFLLLIYGIISFILHFIILYNYTSSSYSVFHGIGDGLILAIDLFPGFFSMVIIVGALLSWVSPDPYNPVVQTIYGISEPLLTPFRKIIPTIGGLDISPIIALICFQVVGSTLSRFIGNILKVI